MEEWWAVIKISLPVILLDELLKLIARRYVDRKKRKFGSNNSNLENFILGGLKSKNILNNVMSMFKNDLAPIDKLSNQQTAHIE